MTDEDQVRDRLRRRFDDDDSTNDENSQPSQTSKNAKNEKASRKDVNGGNAMLAENVKKEWTATSVYLPDFLERQLTTRYKHLDLAFEEEYGRSLQKTRYYYPLVVSLGLERLEGMEPKELKESIERLGREGAQE
jgi:hypothetical protein